MISTLINGFLKAFVFFQRSVYFMLEIQKQRMWHACHLCLHKILTETSLINHCIPPPSAMNPSSHRPAGSPHRVIRTGRWREMYVPLHTFVLSAVAFRGNSSVDNGCEVHCRPDVDQSRPGRPDVHEGAVQDRLHQCLWARASHGLPKRLSQCLGQWKRFVLPFIHGVYP